MASAKFMAISRLVPYTCIVRPLGRCTEQRLISQSCVALAESMTVPVPDGEKKVYPAHIEKIVSDISQLTLLEVADLNAALKERLNIPDAAPMAAMPVGAMVAAAPQDQEESEAPIETQTSFSVKLTAIDPAKKVAIIKFIKSCMEGFNLVQAKKFVEELPVMVKSDLGKDEAEKLQADLKAVGAEAIVE
ncbi:Ribosomal protein L7/L12 [Trinorchestia longiramus]|nr:Ribosomal protein L7/L12 [Trinorchestia longiramus]